ncbi:hypothetical protein QM012_005398 [Aureobasidium pullulans]|uniref:Aldolase n=1 Tax=Aureobasidium pullulans TaxID=5580 RepID=A0ABR0T683_AURPU
MTGNQEKISPLATVRNFRDVASLVKDVNKGLLFRSAQLDNASREELDLLREQYKIRSVIDLRGMKPWPLVSTIQSKSNHDADYVPQYPDMVASTSILGLQLHYITLAGPQYREQVAKRFGVWDQAKDTTKVTPSPANDLKQEWLKSTTTKMTEDRMPVYETVIDHSIPQMKAIFKILADPSSYPVLILNIYGLDFVSMIVILILLVLRVDKDSIHRDYMQDYVELADIKQERIEFNRSIGILKAETVEPYLPFVDSLDQYLQDKYGGVEKYLLHLGLSESEIRAMRDTLRSGS